MLTVLTGSPHQLAAIVCLLGAKMGGSWSHQPLLNISFANFLRATAPRGEERADSGSTWQIVTSLGSTSCAHTWSHPHSLSVRHTQPSPSFNMSQKNVNLQLAPGPHKTPGLYLPPHPNRSSHTPCLDSPEPLSLCSKNAAHDTSNLCFSQRYSSHRT